MQAGPLEIVEEPIVDGLSSHARIPISFTVESVFDVHQTHARTFELIERPNPRPYVKDYDAFEHPTLWRYRFDVTHWGLITAYHQGRRVAGAVLAFKTTGVELLEGRSDLALLWDLRVAPEARRRRVGHALFAAAEAWARARACSELKVETQNINVPACRFYAAQGCELRAAHRGAYVMVPEEIQLLWYKKL